MKLLKKNFCIMLSLMLILNLVTGCSQDTADENLPVLTLALREGIYSDVIKQCIKQFETEEKVHCEILELSEEELHSMVAEDAENEYGKYDLCMVDGSWMAEYTNKNILASLSALEYEIDDDIIPATTEVCYYNNETYLAPYYGNVTVLLYNKAILKKAGYKVSKIKSLEDILNVCKKAQKTGNLGFMYRGDTTNNYVVDFLPILSSFGGWVVDKKNNPTVNTPAFKKAMEYYKKLIATGTAETRDNLTVAIANNAATMAVGWPGWYTPSKKSTADYCAFTGKATKNSKAYNANVYGIWTLGIPENATQKDLSIQLLKYLMDADVQKTTVDYGGVPCRYSSLKDKTVLKKFPQYKAVCKALENGIYRPIMVEWPKFYEILGSEMEKILAGKKSVEKGLSDAQNNLEKSLSIEN